MVFGWGKDAPASFDAAIRLNFGNSPLSAVSFFAFGLTLCLGKGIGMRYVTDPADPRRCKFSYPHEQCWREAEPGCSNCAAHGGKSRANAEETRLYNLVELDNRRR